jgi:hypothetical protein
VWRWEHGLRCGLPRGGRGRRGRGQCSDGIEEDEAAGVARMASGVEEEDGTTVTDGSTGGGGASSAWRKTMARTWLGRQ